MPDNPLEDISRSRQREIFYELAWNLLALESRVETNVHPTTGLDQVFTQHVIRKYTSEITLRTSR